MSREPSSLLDIQGAIERALGFAAGLTEEQFQADEKTRWSVWSQIVVIGEAGTRISEEFQGDHPEVPWKKMIGMRHRVVHGYDQVSWVRVWETVVHDLPELLSAVAPLVPKDEHG